MKNRIGTITEEEIQGTQFRYPKLDKATSKFAKAVQNKFGDFGAFRATRNLDTNVWTIYKDDTTSNPFNLVTYLEIMKSPPVSPNVK